MSDLNLDAIEARAAAAKRGPWVVETPESVYGHDGGPDWIDLRWVSDEDTVGDDDPPWLGPMLVTDAEFIAHARTDVLALVAALREARAGWAADYAVQDDRIGELQAERDEARAEVERTRASLGSMVEWLSEVIVDARDACEKAERIEPAGSSEWVTSGIAMRTTVLREIRLVLDRERNADPSRYDRAIDERDDWRRRYEALRDGVTRLCDRYEHAEQWENPPSGQTVAAKFHNLVARVEGGES